MAKSSKPAGGKKPAAKPRGGPSDNAVDAVHILSGLAELADKFGLMDDAGDLESEELGISFLRLPHAQGLPLPARQSEGASGLDLCAAVPAGQPLTLAPGARALVPTGFAIEIPPSFEGQVRPRSGLALKHGVTVLNAPGTIDSDYRGEIGVLLINHGAEPFAISRGDRIAQLVFGMIVRAVPVEEATLEDSERGSGGFGSTGIKSRKT